MRKKHLGHPLTALLRQRIESEGVSLSELAVKLGFSQSYLSEVLAGDKSYGRVDEDRLRSIASYLEIPAVVAFVLAGKLRHQDFVDKPLELEGLLQKAMHRIAKSSYALEAAVSPLVLMELPANVRMLLVLLFRDATGDSLIPQRRWPWTQAGVEPV